MPNPGAEPLLAVEGLRTSFGETHVVEDVSFSVGAGEIVAMVGKSGSGKSITALSILRLVPSPGRITAGRVLLRGEDIAGMRGGALRDMRGSDVAMVFQDPMTSLNPVLSIGEQIGEAMRLHKRVPPREIAARTVALLRQVGITGAEQRVRAYPHEFSGGMRQRVMIAMALANDPALLIADEPTTALDVTVQAQIVALLRSLNTELGTAVLLITHNVALVARLCQRMVVLYAGRVVEQGTTDALFASPQHPYTWSLLRSVPGVEGRRGTRLVAIPGQPPDPRERAAGCKFEPRCPFRVARCSTEEPPLAEVAPGQQARCWVLMRNVPGARGVTAPLLSVHDLAKRFAAGGVPWRRQSVHAVDGVSLMLRPGETLGLVGESGSGKSTLGRMIVRLLEPSAGRVVLEGDDVTRLRGGALRALRRRVQMIFQDPYASLNPRMTVRDIVAEPLRNLGIARGAAADRLVREALERCGLPDSALDRLPRAFSGGQRQRIGIARALVVQPRLIVADEPVSALDVSIQAQIVNLLQDLQAEQGLAFLFISHDLAVVRHVSDRVAVMYLGRIVEVAAADAVYENPLHPYTRLLLASIPLPDPVLERQRTAPVLQGDPPSPIMRPPGCHFHPRCPIARLPRCSTEDPALREVAPGHFAACHYAEQFLPASVREDAELGAAS